MVLLGVFIIIHLSSSGSGSGSGSSSKSNHNNSNDDDSDSRMGSSQYIDGIDNFLSQLSSSSATGSTSHQSNSNSNSNSNSRAHFDSLGRIVLKNYDYMKPISNFMNSISGLWGVSKIKLYCLGAVRLLLYIYMI
jgi:hypothetical protein